MFLLCLYLCIYLKVTLGSCIFFFSAQKQLSYLLQKGSARKHPFPIETQLGSVNKNNVIMILDGIAGFVFSN